MGRELWICRKSSEVASLGVFHIPLRTVPGNTGRQESHLLRPLPAQTQTPGRSGHICCSAQHWSLTKPHWGQAARPPLPQLPAGGQAGLPQAWPRCRNFFPLAPGLLPIARKEMRPFQRWHRVLVAENCSCFSTSHPRSGIAGTKMPWRSCYTKGNALCLAFGVLVARTAKSQGGGCQ